MNTPGARLPTTGVLARRDQPDRPPFGSLSNFWN